MADVPDLWLGLIGDNIAASRAPLFYRLAGAQHGLRVRYDRLVPRALGQDFDAVFEGAAKAGYRGLNITYPYKEQAAAKVRLDGPVLPALGAVNTVLFEPDGAVGRNTDQTGFEAAYRAARADAAPGVVAMIGTGGVGRAVAFALAGLGAEEIRLHDRDPGRANALAGTLASCASVGVVASAAEAADGASGVVNCTPVGMEGHPGTVLQAAEMRGAEWAFDAVYTPRVTLFLTEAKRAGLAVLSGYELFWHQALHGWTAFTGLPLDEPRLRAELADAAGREFSLK